MACVIIVGKLAVLRFCKRKCTYIHSKEVINYISGYVPLRIVYTCESQAYAHARTRTRTHMYMLFL